MKQVLLICALLASPFAFGHELDGEQTTDANLRAQIAAQLPGTTVIRVSKSDPNKVEIVHVKEKLAPGQKLSPEAKFEQVALNSEIRDINFTSVDEKDATSSTSSWGFGWWGGRRGYGYTRPYYGYKYNYKWGYYPTYSVSSSCYYPAVTNCYYYPTYRVAAYSYVYKPYYTYADNYYNYTYCWY